MLSKSMIPFETSLKKSKKRQAIALAARGGCGGLGQLWEALAELWEQNTMLVENQESFFLQKINPGGSWSQENTFLSSVLFTIEA